MIHAENEPNPAGPAPTREDPMDRLCKLEGLQKDGLIDAAEFKAKHEEITQRKW